MNNKFIKNSQRENENVCSVCVATFKRPELLRKLIHSLFDQKEIEDIVLEIIIVDNDVDKSAKEIVTEFLILDHKLFLIFHSQYEILV